MSEPKKSEVMDRPDISNADIRALIERVVAVLEGGDLKLVDQYVVDRKDAVGRPPSEFITWCRSKFCRRII
jgi:hypothetical protein